MIEEIKQWKKENGNISYSMKELLQGLHVKVDDLKSCQIADNKAIEKNKTNISWHNKGLYGVYVLIVAIFWFLVG